LIGAIIIVWALNIWISRVKNPPVIKFKHMAKVTFYPPTVGAVAGSIPVLLAGGFIKALSSSSML
jgi:hypothetical protein